MPIVTTSTTFKTLLVNPVCKKWTKKRH